MAKGDGFGFGDVQINSKFSCYGALWSQFPSTNAAFSVPSNIAEGAADRTHSQFSNFLANALGSLNDVDTQI